MSHPTVAELRHYGVKGMRWGVRKGEGTPTAKTPVSIEQRGKKLKTAGGEGNAAHPDAALARGYAQVAKKSGIIALSNNELRAYNERLNLEQNALRLQATQVNPGAKFAKDLLIDVGKQELRAAMQGKVSPMSQVAAAVRGAAQTAARKAATTDATREAAGTALELYDRDR